MPFNLYLFLVMGRRSDLIQMIVISTSQDFEDKATIDYNRCRDAFRLMPLGGCYEV